MKTATALPIRMRNLLALAGFALLAACGGGGGSAGAPAPDSVNTPPATVSAPPVTTVAPTSNEDLLLASRLYLGTDRTPAGFDVEARPGSVVGTLSTRHLKNTDLASGSQAAGATFEVCTNDMAQAIDWSERQASWQGQYSDLVEIKSDTRLFEVVRVPRADVTAMIRHRVFRCDYLDRSGTDLRADAGAAGSMNQRPLNADELEALSEYLWQFTMFNNSDYVVASSTRAVSGNSLMHTIRMGQLVRGASGACDTVNLSDWTHTMNSVDGSLTRAVAAVRSFGVRNVASVAQSCAG